MKRKKREPIQNTALVDALAHRRWTHEQGALYLGVPTKALKHWLNYTGKPPKITSQLALRIWELTARPVEDVLAPEFFPMTLGKDRPDKIPPQLLQNIIGSYYLLQNPEVAVERQQQKIAVAQAFRDLPLLQIQVMDAYAAGKADEETAEELDVSIEEVRINRSRAIDTIRRKFFNLTGSLQ